MNTLLICIIAIIAPLSLVAGILVLLGKFDNILLKNAAKNGENINLARSRKILGLTLLSDSIVLPVLTLAVFYFCSK